MKASCVSWWYIVVSAALVILAARPAWCWHKTWAAKP